MWHESKLIDTKTPRPAIRVGPSITAPGFPPLSRGLTSVGDSTSRDELAPELPGSLAACNVHEPQGDDPYSTS